MRNYYIVIYYCPFKNKFKCRAMYNLRLIYRFIEDNNITRYKVIDFDDTIIISKI